MKKITYRFWKVILNWFIKNSKISPYHQAEYEDLKDMVAKEEEKEYGKNKNN